MTPIHPAVYLEKVHIPSSVGTLDGLFYQTAQPSQKPFSLLLMHGLTSGKYSLDGLANYLSAHGYPCLTFDFVGHKLGGTGGELYHPEQIVENACEALLWLHATRAKRVVTVGHSMGGYGAIMAAAKHPDRVAGVATLCTGTHPIRGFLTPVGQAMLRQRADYINGVSIIQFLEQFDSLTLPQLPFLPILCIAGTQDIVVSVDQVKELAALLGPTHQIATIETSHLEAPDRSRATLLSWLRAIESA
ncbi:predicted hydrolase or acyltransferase of alpha/beta superfamily [Chthonomonas calidirosea]|uniref:alpha/beta hydrolase n=1 Tax=Chthonomonas calidirosea TaxID=454171 RepID=UPI0006DD4CB5|nr:alpha/beta hydrolase [Chthonomonas calidirosea]CEK15306.1 predicted hydrolase or acyltransferase of alpha/beta superfamily [Chthonomonas calidirosea]